MRSTKQIKQPEPAVSLLREETGQAATEYALLTFWTVIIIVAAAKSLQGALLFYFQDLASLICLPIP